MKIFDKFTGNEVGEVEILKIEDNSFEKNSMRTTEFNLKERLTILREASDLIDQNMEFLAQTLSMETGKAYRNAEWELIHMKDLMLNPILTMSDHRIAYENCMEESNGIHLFNIPEGIPVQAFINEAITGILKGQKTIALHNPSCPLTTMKISEILGESVKGWKKFITDVLMESQNLGIKKIISSEEPHTMTFYGTPEECTGFSKFTGLINAKMSIMSNSRAVIWDKKYMEYALDWALRKSLTPVSNHRMRVQTIIVKAEFFTYFKNRFMELSKKLKFGAPVDKAQDCNYYPNISEEKRAIQVVKHAREMGFVIEGEEDKRFPIVLHNEYDDLKKKLEDIDGAIAFIVPAKSLKDAMNFSFERKSWETTYLFANGIEEADLVKSLSGQSSVIFNPKKEDIVGFSKHIEKKVIS